MKEDALEIYTLELPLNNNGTAEVVLSGDSHIGNPVYHQTKIPMKIITSQLEYIDSIPEVMVISMGDDMELISKRPASHIRNYGRETLMREEAELYYDLWKDIMYKILARVIGNHELRITREWEKWGYTGVPIIDDILLKENPKCIFAEPERGLILKLKVGDKTYIGYLSHGTGASTTPEYYLKRALRVFEGLDFVALAHIHKTFTHNYPVLVPSNNKNPKRKSRWGIRTGSPAPYLAYAEKRLYTVSEPSNMIITFRSDRKQMKIERLMQDRILG